MRTAPGDPKPTRDARDARILELVCDSCGYRVCTEGILLCDNARRAGFCTREEYERRRIEGVSAR